MIRLSKLADYGIVIMTHLARQPERQQTAPEIAVATSVPQPMTSKILKLLTRADLLVSHRGVAWRLRPGAAGASDQRGRGDRGARWADRDHLLHRAGPGDCSI